MGCKPRLLAYDRSFKFDGNDVIPQALSSPEIGALKEMNLDNSCKWYRVYRKQLNRREVSNLTDTFVQF